jgi:hypothetical protein
MVQVNQDGLRLNVAHQLLFFADDVNIFDGKVYTIEKNTKALLAAEINADKTKYIRSESRTKLQYKDL